LNTANNFGGSLEAAPSPVELSNDIPSFHQVFPGERTHIAMTKSPTHRKM
jgi:hypothetical protein